MDLVSTIVAWTYKAIGTLYVAGIVGGVLILAAERLSRRVEPSGADVRQAAARYGSGTANGR